MTKLELRMTNNELEARVIELETKLAASEYRNGTLINERNDAELAEQIALGKLAELEADIREEAAARPAIPFDTWYANLHPKGAGSNPDLRYLDATRHDRIGA